MRRIVVIGTSGSGKTMLASRIARLRNLAHIELDALHWGPGWTPRHDFVQSVESALGAQAWVVDGNYGKLRPMIWEAADAIVWLDYSMTVTFVRVFRRTFGRWWRRDILWQNNRERLWGQFCTRHSLFLWVIRTWRTHRRDYPKLLKAAAISGKQIVRLRSPRQTETWLGLLGSS